MKRQHIGEGHQHTAAVEQDQEHDGADQVEGNVDVSFRHGLHGLHGLIYDT